MYLVSKVCNTIKEFKYRFENNQIVEYDIVHPSYILKVQEDAFNFCTVPFTLDFNTFYECAISESNKLMGNINLDHEEERNDFDIYFLRPVGIFYTYTSSSIYIPD